MYKTELLHEKTATDVLIDNYTDPDRFIEYCKACPSYNKQWPCPPLGFNPQEFMRKYQYADILGLKIYFDEDTIAHSVSKEEINAQTKKASQYGVDRLYSMTAVLRKQYSDSAMLVYGACPLCKECARLKGQACIHPEEMSYSLSGFGLDMQKIMQKILGDELLWPKDTLPKYLTMTFIFLSNTQDVCVEYKNE